MSNNIYYCVWTTKSFSGKNITGSDMLVSNSKEDAYNQIISRNSKQNIDSTDIKIYDFSKLCEQYNIKFELPKVKVEKKPNVIEHNEEEIEDIF